MDRYSHLTVAFVAVFLMELICNLISSQMSHNLFFKKNMAKLLSISW